MSLRFRRHNVIALFRALTRVYIFFFRQFPHLSIMSHTILLVQPGQKPETRTYSDYESVNECMEGVCKIYEEHLKRQNPNIPSITYDISQLFDFIDQVSAQPTVVSPNAQ